ncbi:MAG: mRNA interferase toxin YafQ [Bacteroides rodentium]
MLTIKYQTAFKKDYKRIKKRGYDVRLLEKVIESLALQQTLDQKYRDHALSGNWLGFRECHIASDWLLIYQIKEEELILALTRTGSHSDLLGM